MRYYLIAGEASGDLHGSNLIKGLAALDSDCRLRFWGGEKMEQTAQEAREHTLVHDYRDGAVMGLTEVLSKAGKLLGRLSECKKDILSFRPDAVILIDYPGFNMKIARFCHEKGIKVFYYIAPKTWASREGRNRKLKKYVDMLFPVFPFELDYFRSRGIPFIYKGNPLLDAVDNHSYKELEGHSEGDYVAILAGSRAAEISRMMPVCMQVVDLMGTSRASSGLRYVIAAAPGASPEQYAPYIQGRSNVEIVFGRTYDVLKGARAAVINSGTASLEAALIGTPQVVGWNTSALTFFAAKYILRVTDHIKYISLGNLCLDKLVFKELIQDDFNAGSVVSELERLCWDEEYRQEMKQSYAQIRSSLGGRGASERVAAAMIGCMEKLK